MRKHWGSYDNHFKEVYVAMNKYIERVLAELKEKNANEPEFLQTAEEVLAS